MFFFSKNVKIKVKKREMPYLYFYRIYFVQRNVQEKYVILSKTPDFHEAKENTEFVFPFWNENTMILYQSIFGLTEEEYEKTKKEKNGMACVDFGKYYTIEKAYDAKLFPKLDEWKNYYKKIKWNET
jgi:hypothetical protein